MSEEYLTTDVPWDDESLVDREPESSGDGRTHFGHLRLHALKVTKVFEAGHFLTIPGVTGGQYNAKDDKGLMMFKGWKAGGNQWLFVLVATKQDKDGNDYQIVKQLPGKLPREGDPHLWGDFTLPSLMELSKAERDKMASEGVYCQWSEVGTGHKAEIDGKEHEIRAWVNFKPFADQAAMKQAETAFWAERGNGTSGGITGTFYPASWTKTQDGVQQMIDYARQEYANLGYKEMATKLGLFDEKTESGDAVDVARVIAQIVDKPQPMVEAALKE